MTNNFNIPPFEYVPPTHNEDCPLINICTQTGTIYDACHKGSAVLSERCSPAQQQNILQNYRQWKMQLELQSLEEKRLLHEQQVQELRDRQAVRRSWVQLFVAAVLGGVFAKLIDWLITFFK